MNPIICLAGPTASGKTALAVELAKELDGEVVSCDSMQVYRRMDIGTAKPTKEEMQGIPHHMIDVASPEEDYSVSRYCARLCPLWRTLSPGGRPPLLRAARGCIWIRSSGATTLRRFPPPVSGSAWTAS